MWRDYDAIAHDAVITTSHGNLQIDYERAYKGHVEGIHVKTIVIYSFSATETKCDCTFYCHENRKADACSGKLEFA